MADSTRIASNPSRSKISNELTKAVIGDKLLPDSTSSARLSNALTLTT